MSQENVKVIRAEYEAWSAGEMDTVASHYSSDAIVQVPFWPDHPEPAVGLAAITEAFARARTDWDVYEVVGHDFVQHGDHVIVPTTSRIRGSGPEVTMEHTNVYTVRGGQIVRLEAFQDHVEALEAVGLAESPVSQENVEVVRAQYETWNEGRTDEFRDLFHPDVAITRFIKEWPEPGPWVGRDAVMTFYEGLRAWDDTTAELVSEFVESGNQVAVRVLWRASIQGQEVGMEVTTVYTLRSGRIFIIEFFRDHAEALEAVDLSE